MLLIAATAVENHMKMIHTMEEVRFFGSYYKTVLDSVSDGVLVIDKRGLLINANKNAEKILSVHGESLLGRPADEILKSGTKIADLLRTGLNTYKDEFTVRYSHNGTRFS
jgi:PAS domain S-box-containing protein